MEDEQGGASVDNIVNEFETYESFLDSQVTSLDLYYLEDEELARQLVELGYRGSGEVLKREEFEMRKAAAEAARLAKKSQKKILASAGKDLKDNFLIALAEREEANRSGRMASIIFIRDYNSHGQEISGYIDYSHRLKIEQFEGYFSGKKKLLPRSTDLRAILEQKMGLLKMRFQCLDKSGVCLAVHSRNICMLDAVQVEQAKKDMMDGTMAAVLRRGR
ncbi:cilia- and flagella-associated protein 299 isoform X2 [Rhincodon typus]|uniref:cilia- and flagella-associated protein 299 isoform X2 n=1 Tax=Rhincodon typus TaxID=259920 RepID=UPI0020304EF2|nr:cilia- and flagella-associated protein 299 isoform X2 [Rhincodon typus]